MAFKLLTGLLVRHFWSPVTKRHKVGPVTKKEIGFACERLCGHTKDCCRWGVRAVTTWQDAQSLDVEKVVDVSMAWELRGPAVFAQFKKVDWCHAKTCAAGGTGLIADKDAGLKDVTFTLHGKPAQKVLLTKVPGDAAASFYVLVVLTKTGYVIYDKAGTAVATLATATDFLKDLKEVLTADPKELTFVKAYVCALFKKIALAPKIQLASEEFGLLKKCEGANKESVVDGAFAKALALAKVGAKWSDDVQGASAGDSRGITFASIACAVLASVSLIYVVLAMKNSRLEVSAEE